ncbi:MAG: FtsW/RodA/SpoVE family cell cycle protein [Coriobacteriia bacterium]|nr:FtsW/RodA/SpoVE family cell cycle protein [Coriobacteriia bacterium]
MQLIRTRSPRNNKENTPATVMWPRIAVITSTVLLVMIGLVMVYSASSISNIAEETAAYADALKQLGFAAVGLALCVVLARLIPYHWWQGPLTWFALGLSVILLALTAAIGTEELGAQRWVNIGPISLQPSEFAKIGLLLAVAKLMGDYQNGAISGLRFLGCFGALNLLIVVLIFYAQSDLGTTMICIVGMLAILWLSEIQLRNIGIYLAGIIVLGVAGLSQGYRAERLFSFMHPWDDYYGTGYQIVHSMYAFAQGGIFGAGVGNSAEKYLYLPEASTDFIFAVIGEELGLIGALFVIGLFIVFLVGGLRMAQEAPDGFGTILCGSFTIIIVFQAFLNMGCVIGLMPITGKPLPFVSAGGSSLIASLMMVGIMLSVSYASGESPVYQRRRESIRPLDRDDASYRGYVNRDYRSDRVGYATGVAAAGMRALPARAGMSRSVAAGTRSRSTHVNLVGSSGYAGSSRRGSVSTYGYSRGRRG